MYKFGLIIAILIFITGEIYGRDDLKKFKIKEAVDSKDGKDKIATDIKLYWGDQNYPPIDKKIRIIKTNRKTNAVGKTDKEACQWVLLSAIIAIQKMARDEGADAVINLQSNYKGKPYSSPDDFECGAGNIVAGVALKGTAVRLKSANKSSKK